MSMAFGAKLGLEPGSWLEAVYDVYIGMIVGANHFLRIQVNWCSNHIIQPIKNLLYRILYSEDVSKNYTHDDNNNNNSSQNNNSQNINNKLRVVAVGYGRTGTYSLTLALEELGFPTLHTQHLYEHEAIMNMWTNDIFLPSIRAQKTMMGRPNLQLIADSGFQATTDLPMALYFEQVMEEFPDCKFILTTRENSEVWFRSWNTLTKSITEPTHLGGYVFTGVRQYSYYLRWLFSVVNKDENYLTNSFPIADQHKEAAIHSYEDHNRRVREKIPSDRLLEYNVKEGWEPLCNFLEIQHCPQTPFPKTNSARSVKVQAISAFLFPMMISLFVLFFAFATIFQRLTGMTVMQWTNWKSRELMMTLRRVMLMGGAGGDPHHGWEKEHYMRKKA